jgi:acetyltransferase-like isoleucine patch superfamily enzyme
VLVAPFASVSHGATVEPHVLLLPYSLVGHDTAIGRYSVLSPHAVVNGESTVDEGVFLGSMACVNPRLKVGAWSKLAAGSISYDNIPAGSLVEGNPAVAHAMNYHLLPR